MVIKEKDEIEKQESKKKGGEVEKGKDREEIKETIEKEGKE